MLILLVSCEKVVDIDLSGIEPQIVIEGIITDQQEPFTVKISKTNDYFNSANYPAVTDAMVTISDNVGNNEILTEISDGIYQTSLIQGVSGRTYTLQVIAEGEEYNATSTMQQAVEVDSISYEYMSSNIGPIEQGYKLTCHYDISDYANTYCRFNIYCNGELSSKYYISPQIFDFGIEEPFAVDDSIRIELLVIDKPIHTYLLMLIELTENKEMTGIPANPTSNFSNNALGYFSACTSRSDSIVIQ